MEFKPVYYSEKMRVVSPNEDFNKENLNIINLNGRSGILTLWTNPGDIWKSLREKNPELFQPDSPIVAISSLYGNGLPQMLANLAYNPQIEFLALTGNDTKAVPSSEYLMNFLTKGIEHIQGEAQAKIAGTQFPIDPQLNPKIFENLKVQRFPKSDLEGIIGFVSQNSSRLTEEKDRYEIKLVEPEFSDFPSDTSYHRIQAKTPLDAWMEVMFQINRFGKNTQIKKGVRRALYNLDVHIDDPSPEDSETLKRFKFDSKELNAYRESIIQGKIPEGTTYTYGNRLREYFGVDSLENVIKRLKNDPMDRRAFVSTWDNANDIISASDSDSSVPCLTDLYFVNRDEKLMLTASFRTHSAVSGWFLNLYGLRRIQEYVSEQTGIEPGKINVKSRWIGIDPEDAKTNSALQLVDQYRRKHIDVNDPVGYFVIEALKGKIVAEHYSPTAQKLKTYTGSNAGEIKDQLRYDSAISNPDHGMWVGYELARAQQKLENGLGEL